MSGNRAILHVDMHAFYAALEQRDHPEWRGRPVVIGGIGKRSVVSTASYEARHFGLHSAMPGSVARRLCPDAVYVAPRMAHYAAVSRQVFAVFARFTPIIESLSLDEAFLDVSNSLSLFGSTRAIGQAIKVGVREATGLSCSVGVASNKLLAKLASELEKPDGLVELDPDSARARLDPLPVGKLWTIGRVAEKKLHALISAPPATPIAAWPHVAWPDPAIRSDAAPMPFISSTLLGRSVAGSRVGVMVEQGPRRQSSVVPHRWHRRPPGCDLHAWRGTAPCRRGV